MTGVILYAAMALLVGGLALFAQWARENRQAEITLIVLLLALSLLVATIGAFTALGLFLTAGNQGDGLSEQFSLAVAGGAALVAGVTGLGLCVPPLRNITGRRLKNSWWADPPVFFALWLFIIVLANNVVSLLIFTQGPNVAEIFPTGRLSLGAILASQVPFLIVAVMGVGPGIRRNLRQTVSRLGYGPLTLKQLGVVAAFVTIALALLFLTDALFANLQPDLYRTVGDLSNSLFNPRGLSPVSAILFALLIGVGAGLGEETLFRGAIQPALGIVATSALFASMHIQYGPSVLLVYVFLLAVGLGLLRRYINTTASFLAHAGYNTLQVILVYFLGT